MGLNDRVSAERVHIGFFGVRNAGKSSVVNAVTGQQISLVSDVKGTTTDPVQKAMEILPMGPVVIIDTPGIDDEGELGEMRVRRTREVLSKTDVAVLVVDATLGLRDADREICDLFRERDIPYIVAYNKSDLDGAAVPTDNHAMRVSAVTGQGIHDLRERLGHLTDSAECRRELVGDLISAGDVVVLVTPIDESAPRGRMSLPQQQMIRDVLDHGAINVVVKETELPAALGTMASPPRMVITDSQAFGVVAKTVPHDVPLTSFSILFARYKGELSVSVRGVKRMKNIKDGDRILISEGCTHHRQCGDIGTVKLPRWIREYTNAEPEFEFTSGGEFPEDLSRYSLIIHCGACMLSEREMRSRLSRASAAGIPITNYGIAIAEMHGILERALSPFSDVLGVYRGE